MLKLILGLGAIYAIAYSVSTPELRAAARGPVNEFGKSLFALAIGLLAIIGLIESGAADEGPPADPPGPAAGP